MELHQVARLLACLDISAGQMMEVSDAVSMSSDNGYDEEYMMKDLFSDPGLGVGGVPVKGGSTYSRPLRDMIASAVREGRAVRSRASTGFAVDDPEGWLEALERSDIQIYWPFRDSWDGRTLPVITFDPGDESEENVGYKLLEDGSVEEVTVNESFARTCPVWVVNRNDDSGYPTLEMLRRNDPDWGQGGGTIVVGHHPASARTRASGVKTLVLKDFTALRNFDCWFAGASEFFVKVASVENFVASTEAELRLYNPEVTDFMMVVKRDEVGVKRDFEAVLVSEWTPQLEKCAFMIIEDDGGSKSSWDCSATVKINSKSYGLEVSLPFSSYDDVVWRGQLSYSYLEASAGKTGHYGDVDLSFGIIGY